MAMRLPRHVVFAAPILFTACQDQVPLYHGKWIDVAGFGRERSDTCRMFGEGRRLLGPGAEDRRRETRMYSYAEAPT